MKRCSVAMPFLRIMSPTNIFADVYKDICTRIFTETFVQNARDWNLPKYLQLVTS